MNKLISKLILVICFLTICIPSLALNGILFKAGLGLYVQDTDSYYTTTFFTTNEYENSLTTGDYSFSIAKAFDIRSQIVIAPEITLRSFRFSNSCRADDEDIESGLYKVLMSQDDKLTNIEYGVNLIVPVKKVKKNDYYLFLEPLFSVPINFSPSKNDELAPELSDFTSTVGIKVGFMASAKNALFEVYSVFAHDALSSNFNARWCPCSIGISIGYQFLYKEASKG